SFVTGSMAFGETHHSSNQAMDTTIEGLSDASIESAPTTTLYSCPMHPNETSDKPGRCSICGMHLVAQTDTDHSGHDHQSMSHMDHSEHDHHQGMSHADHEHEDHQVTYACPMHPNETSDKPGRCSICGMHLVAQTDTDHSGHDHHQPMSHTDHSDHDHQAMSHSDHSGHDHQAMSHADHSGHDMKSMPPGSGMPKAMSKPKRYWDSDQLPSISSRSKASKEKNENTLLSKAKRVPVNDSPEQEVAVSQDTHTDHDHQHSGTTYICPMHPQIISHDADASCPICGMNLVPVAAAKQSLESENPQVFLESAVIQNMGIRTITAERRNLGKTIKTQGRVTADDERIYNIHSRTGGWIENLYLITEGDHIERKDELVDFYSPWINRAQLDLIEALEEFDLVAFEPERKAELDAKIDSYRNTLRSLKVPPMDLMRIEQYRKVLNTVQITSPASGWITELNVSEGSYVEPYQTMFTLVDLSEVWIMVDIFEHQAPWVKKGNKVSVTSPAIPGREWTGRIDFIYPEINPVSRTLRARIEVTNPDEALLLNMFVQVEISDGASKKNAVTVPREAIILTGEREIIVKYQGKGHFQPVDVKTGLWGDNQVEIIDGLNEGAEVVVSGQFLIDSESNIQNSLLRMAE
ncbi:MAG: efflux RND transporter periplasmic adaptor subunit, partial [Candidatus Thiodiazotropha sp. 'RUGA']|nr:efflux RND transporter periplasmic adaptor subunit [Candidatus Thiodiazotropha sp. 'RUGA']